MNKVILYICGKWLEYNLYGDCLRIEFFFWRNIMWRKIDIVFFFDLKCEKVVKI